MAKLTKAQVRNMAREYIADLLVQEQMPPIPFEHDDAELFMEEIARIAGRVRSSVSRTALSKDTPDE